MFTFTIVAVLIAIVVVAIVALPRSTNAVPLPGYLDKCVANVTVHYHPQLFMNISGSPYVIPANIGITGGCNKPLHTHDTTGTIHVESDENRTYTLRDFFLIWGNTANNPTMAVFNSTQIFSYKANNGNGHTLLMTVNNQPNNEFQNLVLPYGANPTSNPQKILIYYT